MTLRSALLLLLLGFAVGASVFLLVKGGLVGLPTSPFGDDRPALPLTEEAELAEKRLANRFPEMGASRRRARKQAEPIHLRVYASDLRDLAISGLARSPEGRRVLELAREIHAEIDDGEVGVELVVNLTEIPRERLSDQERETVERLQDLLPMVGHSDVPIGIYGSPEASRGRLRLGGRPWFKISFLKLSLATVSERLGIPAQDLERSLEFEWPGFEVLDVTIEDGALELRVERAV